MHIQALANCTSSIYQICE